ncbi:hypothetical protein ITP53_32085 [Nonomuraea sp. K274]|uniref:Uncharacterized protein n=1 Tax=Nonomuraea cypriaca TaxID=1187855 RepID=A0A931AGY8_9ACTN|nr:hypothetical protein [Nonomuraea cypriaca]MBF8190278.1 hypothetical protein [Nonomuraea cypriaca]
MATVPMPPISRMGAIVAVERVLARTPALAVLLPMIQVYDTGCLLNIDIVARNATAPPGLALRLDSAFSGEESTSPHVTLRYPNGVEIASDEDGHAAPPSLSWFPGGVRGDAEFTLYQMPLWLFPLPPPGVVLLTLNWPWAGIGPEAVRLDGAAITEAAARSTRCWPGEQGRRAQ